MVTLEDMEATTVMAYDSYNNSFDGGLFNASGNVTDDDEAASGGKISLNFLDSFVKALSVMIVSELGDKTFFLAAILAMRYNKLTVFLGSISSLVLMTVVSALLGWGVTSLIPKIYTFYASVVIMVIFGIKMFYDAWKMKPNEAQELQNEAETEINKRERRGSERQQGPEVCAALNGDQGEVHVQQPDTGFLSQLKSSVQCWKTQEPKFLQAPTSDPNEPVKVPEQQPEETTSEQKPNTAAAAATTAEPDEIGASTGAAVEAVAALSQPDLNHKEPSRFGKQCLKIFKVFVNSFGLIFLAEWGDRSQLATIVLASVNDVAGIILGGVLGHTLCTGLAVLAGALIAKKISVRAVTIIGGIVFIGFAIATLVIGPEADEDITPETTNL